MYVDLPYSLLNKLIKKKKLKKNRSVVEEGFYIVHVLNLRLINIKKK